MNRLGILKTLRSSDSILLPLVPTIGGTIANFLRLFSQKTYINLTINSQDLPIEVSSHIPIRRVSTARYQYVSAIAHQLTTKLQLSPVEICQHIQTDLIATRNSHAQRLLVTTAAELGQQYSSSLEILYWYTDAGYCYFQLTDRSIATWLNYIYLCDSIVDHDPQVDCSKSRFSIPFYAHARCNSLLKLAHTEQLIFPCEHNRASWDISMPDWFGCDFDHINNPPRRETILNCKLSAEHQLIHALMDVLDGIYGNRRSDKLKLTIDLAQHWLEFYRHCRIFGDLQRQNPHLAIARCGLTAISQRYLRILLEDYLGVTAPIEF